MKKIVMFVSPQLYDWKILPSFHQMFLSWESCPCAGSCYGGGHTQWLWSCSTDLKPYGWWALKHSSHMNWLTKLSPGKYSLCHHPYLFSADTESLVNVTDVSIYNAADMLALEWVDSEASFNAFVWGQTENTYICVDFEQDHVPLDTTKIGVSVDMDNLIWVTWKHHFQKSASIFLGSILDKKVSIRKHNHVYTEILLPQSEENAGTLGGWTEWLSVPCAFSSISHTTLGSIGGGSGSLNIYIFSLEWSIVMSFQAIKLPTFQRRFCTTFGCMCYFLP